MIPFSSVSCGENRQLIAGAMFMNCEYYKQAAYFAYGIKMHLTKVKTLLLYYTFIFYRRSSAITEVVWLQLLISGTGSPSWKVVTCIQ